MKGCSEGEPAGAGHDDDLIGRGRELAAVVVVLDRTDRGGWVLVEGEAGIGKTRFTLAAARAARDRGYLVMRGCAREFDSRRPFAAPAEALGVPVGDKAAVTAGATEREIASLLAGHLPPGSDQDLPAAWPAMESRIGELMLALLDEQGTERPVLLVLEDLHWADAATLAFLHRLALVGHRPGFVLLGTVRPLPHRPELTALLDPATRQDLLRLPLQPLSPTECAELAAAVLGRPADPALLRLLEGAGGNPLFLTETLGALRAEGALGTDDEGRVTSSGEELPSSLGHTIRSRLGYLAAPVLQTLGLASVLGARFRIGDLARLADRPVAWCWERLRDAVDARVLADEGEGEWLVFRHELFRDALYLELPAAVRAGLHDDAARVLHGAGAPASEVAEHVLRGSGRGDRTAVGWLREAATQATLQSPTVAVELLEGCLRLTAPTDPDHATIQHELATVQLMAGRPAASEATCRQALAGPHRGVDAARLRAVLAEALLEQGRMAEAEEHAAAVLEVVDVLPPTQRARFLSWWALLRLLVGDLAGAVQAAERAEAFAAEVADPPALISARLTQAHVARYQARLADADRLAAAAVQAAEEEASVPAHAQTPHLVHGLVLIDCDRLEQAAAVIERGRRAAEVLGTATRLVLAQFTEVGRLYTAGLWDDAVATLEGVWPLALETGLDYQVDTLFTRALIAAHRGDGVQARAWSQRAEAAMAGGMPPYRPGWVGWARATLASAAGQPAAAPGILEAAWAVCAQAGMACDERFLGPALAWHRAGAGAPALEGGEVSAHQAARVLEVVTALEAQAAANPDVPGLRAAALQARGSVEHDADLHLAALGLLRDGPRPYEAARCAEEAALILAGHGRGDEAVAVATEALAGYGTLAADGDASRARSMLRAAGLRLGVRGPRRRPSHGWLALTPTEAKVARLVAQRMSNPEIAQAMYLSRRTVATHVSHLLAKLGMSSRAELVAAAAAGRLGDLDAD